MSDLFALSKCAQFDSGYFVPCFRHHEKALRAMKSTHPIGNNRELQTFDKEPKLNLNLINQFILYIIFMILIFSFPI